MLSFIQPSRADESLLKVLDSQIILSSKHISQPHKNSSRSIHIFSISIQLIAKQ